MSWYFRVKLAQLWEINSDGEFDDELRRIYELEYKLSMLGSRPFSGMPKRQQAILARLEDEARDSVTNVVDALMPVFEKWLQGHALTNPDDWSDSQMEFSREELGDDFDQWWDNFMATGQNYRSLRPSYSQENTDCSELFQILTQLDNNGFEMFMRDWAYGKKEAVQENKWSDWNSGHSEHETEEELELAIEQEQLQYDQQTIGDYFEAFSGPHCSSVQEALRQVAMSTGIEPLFRMLYSKFLFPKWFAHWQPQGIEDTRHRRHKAKDFGCSCHTSRGRNNSRKQYKPSAWGHKYCHYDEPSDRRNDGIYI